MLDWERESERLAVFSGRRAGRCSRISKLDQRYGLPQRTNPASAPLEASWHFRKFRSLLSGFLLHDRDVSIGLVGYHLPAAGQAGQDRGFRPALRQQHETMAFISLSSAPV